MRDRLKGMPALVIWGMKDPAFQPRLLERWRATLPQATVVRLPVGHWPQEESPEEVIRVMQDFLASSGSIPRVNGKT
jgi:haloalkane dehalogenase